MRTTKWYYRRIRISKTVEELELLLLMASIQTVEGKMKRRTLVKIMKKIKEKNESWKSQEKNTTEDSEKNTKE